MESLAKTCQKCRENMNGGVYRAAHVCPHCLHEHDWGKAKSRKRFKQQEEQPEPQQPEARPETAVIAAVVPTQRAPAKIEDVVLTAKAVEEHAMLELIDELEAECVLSIKLTPDLVSNGKFVGGKSEKVKAALAQGKKHALLQLRQKAHEQTANLVVAVSVKNSIKVANPQTLNIIVKASGMAARTESATEVSEV
jgi:uncharacterized protein YbjQ (UPF0145 family)